MSLFGELLSSLICGQSHACDEPSRIRAEPARERNEDAGPELHALSRPLELNEDALIGVGADPEAGP